MAIALGELMLHRSTRFECRDELRIKALKLFVLFVAENDALGNETEFQGIEARDGATGLRARTGAAWRIVAIGFDFAWGQFARKAWP